jgi:hypothetical protein
MLIKPLGTSQTLDLIENASDLDNAKCVLASNGGEQKRFVLLAEGSTIVASVCLPRYSMVKIRKDKAQKIFAAQGQAGSGDATNVTFTKISFTD